MLVFPIAEDGAACCRFEKLKDGTVCLVFRQDGKPRYDLSVVTQPQPGQYALVDSFLSGGSFRGYLSESMERFHGRICLYLREQAYRFPLPCPDGRGEPIALPEREADFRYSEALCCLRRIALRPEAYVELADCARSVREKYRIAEETGIPLLIAEKTVLDIVKAPCGQGA